MVCVPFVPRTATVALLITASVGVSGCSIFVATTNSAIRSEPADLALKFPDPSKYLQCIKTPKGDCNAAGTLAVSGPVDLSQSRAIGGACTVGEVAQGVAISLAARDPTALPFGRGLKRTQEVAIYGIATGISPRAGIAMSDLKAMEGDKRVVPGTDDASLALSGETAQQIHDYYWAILAVRREGRAGATLQLSGDGMIAFTNAIGSATVQEAWTSQYHCSLGRLQVAEARIQDIRLEQSQRLQVEREIEATATTAKAAAFVSAYLKAYFRSGQFFDFVLDPAQVLDSLKQELKAKLHLNDAEADALAKKIVAEFPVGSAGPDGKIHFLTKLQGAFVTRGGKRLAFPDVDVTFTPLATSPLTVSKIDLTAVGSDVVRVFVEAVGDSIAELPGDAQSTGCKTMYAGASGNSLLKCFVPEKEVTAEAFASVNEKANSVDTMVGTAVGKVIRGASWISLNNEALAKAIETAVAVAARKATEKFVWCFYACGGASSKEALIGVPWQGERSIPFSFRP